MAETQHGDSERLDERQLMEERVRVLCRQQRGARLAGALLELAREVTHSPSGFLGTVWETKKLRINALTPDLRASVLDDDHTLKHVELRSWTDSWAGALLSNATVLINAPHRLGTQGLGMARSLAVPVVFAGGMVGIIYVANKNTDYDGHDALMLEQIAHWSAIEIRDFVGSGIEAEVVTVADEPTMPTGEAADWLNEKFRLLFELAPIGMVLSELDGRFLLPNQAFLDIIGYTRDEMLALSERALSPSFTDAHSQNIVRALTEHGRFGPLEHRYQRKDGTEVHVLLHGLVIKAIDGTPYRWTFVQDITESKNIAAALQKSKRAIDAAARAKDDFVTNVSHELRTPINGVIGLSNLLMDTPLSEQQRDYVTSLARSGQALVDLVNDILDFSQLEAGRIVLELHPFDLRAMVEQTVELVAEQASDKGLRVDLAYDPALPEQLIGDAGRVQQVLFNLLTNAIKFTERGSIDVRVEEVSISKADVIVAIAVRDTGIGIADEMRHHIFGLFTQVDASSTRRVGGTGLGLAISKRLIDLMGGTIEVDSRLGQGSTFRVTARFNRVLESSDTSSERIAVPRDERAADKELQKHRRVLVAEDNRVNQLVLVHMLERLGYRADAVANGLEVIAAMRQTDYDLVLMDCHMPEMDGFEATRRIRSGAAGAKDVAIIAVTAGANRARCSDVGMNDYLTKPIDPVVLGKAIERWLPR